MKKGYKKTTIVIALMLLLSISALGAWQIKVKSNKATGSVVSNEKGVLTLEQNILDFNLIDTDNSSYTETLTSVIRNHNGDLNFTFNVTETRDDFEGDACTAYENDVVFTYNFNGVDIVNGQEILIPSGYSDLNITLDAVMASCPGNVSVVFELN